MKSLNRVMLMAAVLGSLVLCVSLFASKMDIRIESAAKESYVFKTYLKQDNIKVVSRENGIVTLTGMVSEESHKELAEETVSALPGVKKVINSLEVKSGQPSPGTDTWIGMKVKAALLFHRSVSAISTNVYVKDGIVTLSGTAINGAQKELTTEYAKDVEGVKAVQNIMRVPKNSMTPMETVVEKVDDASITAQVKMTLLIHRSTSALYTKVETNNGVVTVSGKARNMAEKDLVSKLIRDVHGVKGVANKMMVEGSIS